MHAASPPDANQINFSWLLRLRWGAIIGQSAVILGVHVGLGVPLNLAPLGGIIALEVATNLALAGWRARGGATGPWLTGLTLALDLALLTLLLHFSGGPANPFSFLYLIHLALAAVTLGSGWSWALAAFSIACFGLLFLLEPGGAAHAGHGGHGGHGGPHDAEAMRQHLQGMYVAFSLAAIFIVFFVQRVRLALAAREEELGLERARREASERLASLTTLAAGAAHELATPLSTIAVVAKELERRLTRAGGDADSVEDAQLIRSQVQRCREVLDQMAADAGQSAGEAPAPTSLEAIFARTLAHLGARPELQTALAPGEATLPLCLPEQALARALRGLVRNSLDAGATAVEVEGRLEGDEVAITVRDDGEGIDPEHLARLGEPFFTTKAPGAGMGLGVFLTRVLVERLGGSLRFDARAPRGTLAQLRLPRRASA